MESMRVVVGIIAVCRALLREGAGLKSAGTLARGFCLCQTLALRRCADGSSGRRMIWGGSP